MRRIERAEDFLTAPPRRKVVNRPRAGMGGGLLWPQRSWHSSQIRRLCLISFSFRPRMTRQQFRQVQRARVKRGEASLKHGLPDVPAAADLVDTASALLQSLAKPGMARPASTVAATAQALNSASIKARPGQRPLACAAGCSACCHTWVAAAAPEIFRLADHLRARPDAEAEVDHVRQRAAATVGLTPTQRFGAKRPCPLLAEDGRCGVYDYRPTACRQATSYDLAACQDEFEGREFGGDMEVSRLHMAHARNAFVVMAAALKARGYDTPRYELSEALLRAIEQPDAEARWLAGEDVFAGVARAPADPRIDADVAALARSLSA